MKVIIVGCGRMGASLALQLSKSQHDVTMIDASAEALKHLSTDTKIDEIVGIGFDKDVLEASGIERADALVACTSSDESNALIGRIAKNIYRVPKVITRLYDPRKAEIYNMLGLETISTTDWGIKRAIELINYSQLDSILSLSDGDVELIKIEVPELLIGKSVNDLNEQLASVVVCLTRNNKGTIPTLGTVFEKGDIVYVSVLHDFVAQFKERVGL